MNEKEYILTAQQVVDMIDASEVTLAFDSVNCVGSFYASKNSAKICFVCLDGYDHCSWENSREEFLREEKTNRFKRI